MPKRIISVTGLGYVGLPVAVALAGAGFQVTGYDKSKERIDELKSGRDRTLEVPPKLLSQSGLVFTSKPEDLEKANFHIVAVPTPVKTNNEPDLTPLIEASKNVGKFVSPGDIVVFESTVFPGCTEEICKPIIEEVSGLKAPLDFALGYSPERINPGDKDHRLASIVKVISAQNDRALDIIADVYGSVVDAGLHRAETINVAEAAKVIENIQRDVNIALINELSQVFEKLGIDTYDVLKAAKTKWNFLPFEPGMVGGHCIGVDPYYLTYKASTVGVDPKLILSGRATNNNVTRRVADYCREWVVAEKISKPEIVILGATFKENVPDTRNSQIPKLISELQQIDCEISIFDPFAEEFGASLTVKGQRMDCFSDLSELGSAYDVVILAVPHKSVVEQGWHFIQRLVSHSHGGLVFDIKAVLARSDKPENLTLKRL